MSRPVAIAFLAAFCVATPAQLAPRWVDKETNLERYGARLTFDAVRERLVAFGGSDGWTWAVPRWLEWDGVHWFGVGELPGAVTGALVADRARRVVLLANAARSWTFDGRTWSQHANPLPAGVGEGVEDPVRGRVVLLWRSFATPDQGELWEWDGTAYTLIPAGAFGTTATPRTAVWHAGLGRTLHLRASASAQAELWGWDGIAWRPEPAGDRAPRLGFSALAYDIGRDRIVLAGGGSPGPVEVWEWDRREWVKASTSGLDGRFGFALAYDAARGQCVLFGGFGSARELGETWAWDGRLWTLRANQPLRRDGHALAADDGRGVVVLFGGSADGYLPADTWEWDGVAWRTRTASGPTPRRAHAMAYDAARGRTVLFGGVDAMSGFRDDTWEWDGQTWSVRTSAVRPPARAGQVLAYDVARRRVVLFGGNAQGQRFNDTWEWDGSNWLARATAIAPVATGAIAMAHDQVRRRTVLALTAGPVTPFETWEWDGVAWRSIAAPGARPIHAQIALAWDSSRARIVLTGGQAEVLEYDGAAWTTRASGAPGEVQRGAKIAYHAATRRLVAFGGVPSDQGGSSPATYVFGDTVEGVATPYGSACGGSRLPGLARRGRSAPGNARYAIDLLDGATRAPAALLLASAAGSTAIGPCTLHLSPGTIFATLGATTSVDGFATFPLPLPRGPWLVGTVLHAQAACADASAPLAASLTPGLRVPIGD